MTNSNESTSCPASSNTTTRVQRLLRDRFELRDEQIAADQPLADLGIDSLASIEFLFDLEQEFGISFSDERSPVRTIGDIALMVERELAMKAAAA